jgi:hypothetical protein
VQNLQNTAGLHRKNASKGLTGDAMDGSNVPECGKRISLIASTSTHPHIHRQEGGRAKRRARQRISRVRPTSKTRTAGGKVCTTSIIMMMMMIIIIIIIIRSSKL